MQKTNSCIATNKISRVVAALAVAACLLLIGVSGSASATGLGENLNGFFAREGNNESPARTAGNNIYLKFFDDRWIALLFVPYPYAADVDAGAIERVFKAARSQTSSASYLKGDFGELEQAATVQIERYGYLQDRIAFECGALSACTIKLGGDYVELIKPGVINPHIVRYHHVVVE